MFGSRAIGHHINCRFPDFFLLSKSLHFSFVNAIHPSAVMARTSKLGTGVVMVAGAVINPGSAVGDHTIRSSARVTRIPGSPKSTSMPTHSLVQSSITLRVRNRRPDHNVSETKSKDQRSFGFSGTAA